MDVQRGHPIDVKKASDAIYQLCLFTSVRTTDSFAQQALGLLIELALSNAARASIPSTKCGHY